MVTHLIDREHTAAHHLCFRVGEGREDEPWTIAEADFLPQIESLEMLGLARHGGDADFLASKEHVDNGTLAYVRVAYRTYDEFIV